MDQFRTGTTVTLTVTEYASLVKIVAMVAIGSLVLAMIMLVWAFNLRQQNRNLVPRYTPRTHRTSQPLWQTAKIEVVETDRISRSPETRNYYDETERISVRRNSTSLPRHGG